MTNSQPKRQTVSRSAFKVLVGSVLSLLAGLGSQIAIAALFGTGTDMDAFLTALVVPAYLEAVLLSGLQFVFIPAFIEEEASGAPERAWALAGTVFWITAGALGVVAALGVLGASSIIGVTAPGLAPEKAALASRMLRVMIVAVPLHGLGALCRGVQNARDRFFWPAMGGTAGSLGNLLTLVALYPVLGPMTLAWAYLVSVASQAVVTVMPVLRHGWGHVIPLRDSRVREMGRLIAPLILAGIVTRWTPLMERYFASGLPDGHLSYIGYATKVARSLDGVVGGAIATVIFPAMARAFARHGAPGLADRSAQGFRLAMAIGLPCWALLTALSVPTVQLLFERGAFDHAATLSVSRILPLLVMSGVTMRMVGNVMSRTFYVTKDTRTVPIVSTVTSVLYVPLAMGLTRAWGYVGLAWAQPLHSGIALLALTAILAQRLRFRAVSVARSTAGHVLTGVATYAGARLLLGVLAGKPAAVQLLVAVPAAFAAYLAVLHLVDRRTAAEVLTITGIPRLLTVLGSKPVRSPGDATVATEQILDRASASVRQEGE